MVVGLTGGIGSGKSTVARLFEMLGCLVFESDVVAKEIYFEKEIKPKIISLLGEQAYLSQNSIDKAYISSRIFTSPDLLKQLNCIIHPAVIQKSRDFIQDHPGKIILKETALLFETGLDKEMDKIILVAAEDSIRIKRTMQRDGLTRDEVLQKIKNQSSQEENMAKSDFIIHNDEKELVIPQVLNIYNTLVKS